MYASEHVFETEEIVVATNTMSYQDYRECRKLQLIMEVYHREGLLREFLEYLNKHDVQISAFMLDLLDHLGEAPNEVRGLFEDYMSEADNELFDSREQVHQTMAANYESLVTEDVGGQSGAKVFGSSLVQEVRPGAAICRATGQIVGVERQRPGWRLRRSRGQRVGSHKAVPTRPR